MTESKNGGMSDMANVIDYIEWRGDLTFEKSPFCEVDNLLLSTAAFIDFQGIVSADPWGMPVKLSVSAERYREKYPEGRYYGVVMPADIETVFYKMAKSPRFRDIYLTCYISDLNETEGKQFGAVTMVLPDNSIFISYRGTDDTITGWREDFNLSFTFPVPSQKAAVEYLETVASFHRGGIRLGGHSKGGNLAVYAAAMCREEFQGRIINAYSNDGPGFMAEFIESDEFRAVEERVVTYVPQSSVVGMLLSHSEAVHVIESDRPLGIQQHDPLSWKVLGTSFVHLDNLSDIGLIHKDGFRRILDGMNTERRRRFTDIVFQIIEATEAKTLTELSEAKLKNAMIMLRAYNELDREGKEEIREFIRSLAVMGADTKK
ncbi:MAG: DUF2974 domain-containing protein [Ruminococcaceae bacterium]|nr:DUF2974 domain-containing protein [Oscillospiraceae bacterium]